jgi:hypothetical protein
MTHVLDSNRVYPECRSLIQPARLFALVCDACSHLVRANECVSTDFCPNRADSSVGGGPELWVAAKRQARNPSLVFDVMEVDRYASDVSIVPSFYSLLQSVSIICCYYTRTRLVYFLRIPPSAFALVCWTYLGNVTAIMVYSLCWCIEVKRPFIDDMLGRRTWVRSLVERIDGGTGCTTGELTFKRRSAGCFI